MALATSLKSSPRLTHESVAWMGASNRLKGCAWFKWISPRDVPRKDVRNGLSDLDPGSLMEQNSGSIRPPLSPDVMPRRKPSPDPASDW